jgi:flagellar hook-length control protein FliK
MNPLLSPLSAMTGSQNSNVLASLLSGTAVSGPVAGLFGNVVATAGQDAHQCLPFNAVLQTMTAAHGNGSLHGNGALPSNVVKAANKTPAVNATMAQQVVLAQNTTTDNAEPHMPLSHGVSQTMDMAAGDAPVAAEGEVLPPAEMTDPAAMVAAVMPQTTDTPNTTDIKSDVTAAVSMTAPGDTPASNMAASNEAESASKQQVAAAAPAGGSNASDTAGAVQAALTAGLTGVDVAHAASGKALAQAQAHGHKSVEAAIAPTPGETGSQPAQTEKPISLSMEESDPRQSLMHAKNGNAASAGQGGAQGAGQEGGGKSQNGQANPSAATPSSAAAKDGPHAPSLAQFLAAQDKPSLLSTPTAWADDPLANDPAFLASYDMAVTPSQSLSASVSRQALAAGVALSTASHAATQIAVHIQHGLRHGQNDFLIRLDPPELGRIDVKLEFGDDGRVTALLTTDNERTLHMFERHQGLLERALQDAGLKTDSGSLSFTLQHGDQQQAHKNNQGNTPGHTKELPVTAAAPESPAAATLMMSDRALDIRV